jgi:hypothetical protein
MVFLSVDLRVIRFNLTIPIQNAVQILAIFHFFFFFIKILFAVFNVLSVAYSLAKNNLNNLSIQHDIKKKF